jgi:ABC-type dipeptide/oligopeptide/nickel transport system permease component
MSLQLVFTGLTLALLVGAGLLLLAAAFRRGRQATNVLLAIVLIALAIGVWWTAIRSPLTIR